MREFKLERNSLNDLFAIIEQHRTPPITLFRGQSNSEWGLTPSLFREGTTDNPFVPSRESYEQLETDLLGAFFREGFLYLPNLKHTAANKRILAQHFGVPTRLLDWSTDPLVALFFAIERWDRESDAALFMLSPSIISDPDTSLSLKAPNGSTIAFAPPAFDRRISAQKSIFTFTPYGPEKAPFKSLDKRSNIAEKTVRIVIARPIKKSLFQNLLEMGVDRRNLFPGLDGVGAYLATRAKCQMFNW